MKNRFGNPLIFKQKLNSCNLFVMLHVSQEILVFPSRHYVPPRRVKQWGFSLSELLADPLGRRHFTRFLEKEISAENLG